MITELIRYSKKIAMRAALYPLKLLPLRQNRVFLYNSQARDYSANPRYVGDYLLEHYEGKFEIVVCVKELEKYENLRSKGIILVRPNSFRYFFYAMTSKVFLTNCVGHSYIPLGRGTHVINTYHGGGAYKKIGRHMFSDTWLYHKDLTLSARQTTLFLSTCRRFTEIASDALLMPKKIFWEIGMPRNDMLIARDGEQYRAVREKLGLKEDERLVLYAPTYRKRDDNYFKDTIAIPCDIDCERVLRALSRRFGGKWKFGFRLHPLVVNRDELPHGEILNLSDYEEMQELLLAADAMINDFSSSMWDYMLTRRPSFMYAPDLEHYLATTGVYTPVSEWPFPKATDNDGLVRNILNFDEKSYKEACARHYKALGGHETGSAASLVCEYIYKSCFCGESEAREVVRRLPRLSV